MRMSSSDFCIRLETDKSSSLQEFHSLREKPGGSGCFQQHQEYTGHQTTDLAPIIARLCVTDQGWGPAKPASTPWFENKWWCAAVLVLQFIQRLWNSKPFLEFEVIENYPKNPQGKICWSKWSSTSSNVWNGPKRLNRPIRKYICRVKFAKTLLNPRY